MAEQQTSALGDNTLKVLTFGGPLLASSLAITYDVGFFVGVGIGYFSFFSLSEHLVFALQSLPFAIPPVAVLLIWVTTGWYGYQQGYNDAVASESVDRKSSKLGSLLKRVGMEARTPWALWLMDGMLCLGAFANLWVGQYAMAFMLSALAIYVLTAPGAHKTLRNRLPVLMAICVVAALVLSFLIGLQRADSILKSKDASEMISVDDRSIPARLIRGGDKGILFFSLESRKVRFLRWDSIKQIETL
ncbi:hypothetical protein [Bradyrhizobium symbiodeficiens]|uniref:Uncharacterized protein n=1 Tax=Bradyrhizobium symbiodeficiens TaxID=1404367 RepID=A0A6G8ZZV2_9BRAD|nr:hypothetical protein [Bradyrhizobium symbiodeficiens]QIP05752.1 hypothetical protein HAV00_05595 [Bradyrhizobium symbiodeficiens]